MAVKPLTSVGISAGVIALLACRLLPRHIQQALSLTGLLLFLGTFVGAVIYRRRHPKPDKQQEHERAGRE